MAATDLLALDGNLDDETLPGPLGSTVRFRLVISPTEDLADETVLSCAATDPLLAAAVLHELEPGDLLRVTGYLPEPDTSIGVLCLQVLTLEVLDTAPLQGLGIAHRGPYRAGGGDPGPPSGFFPWPVPGPSASPDSPGARCRSDRRTRTGTPGTGWRSAGRSGSGGAPAAVSAPASVAWRTPVAAAPPGTANSTRTPARWSA